MLKLGRQLNIGGFMKKNTASEIEELKKEMALRNEFYEFKNLISNVVRLMDYINNLVLDYIGIYSARKDNVVGGRTYSFKNHSKTPLSDVRETDLQYAVYERQINRLRDRLIMLANLKFEEYKKHKKVLDKIIFFYPYSDDITDIRDPRYMDSLLDPYSFNVANELSRIATSEDLLNNQLYENERNYLPENFVDTINILPVTDGAM